MIKVSELLWVASDASQPTREFDAVFTCGEAAASWPITSRIVADFRLPSFDKKVVAALLGWLKVAREERIEVLLAGSLAGELAACSLVQAGVTVKDAAAKANVPADSPFLLEYEKTIPGRQLVFADRVKPPEMIPPRGVLVQKGEPSRTPAAQPQRPAVAAPGHAANRDAELDAILSKLPGSRAVLEGTPGVKPVVPDGATVETLVSADRHVQVSDSAGAADVPKT